MTQDNTENTSEAPQIKNLFTLKNRKIESNFRREDSYEEFAKPYTLRRSSSFKQVCQFPISFCRRNSKDFMTWVNGLTITKSSPLNIVGDYYEQLKPASLLHVLICFAVFILVLEVCLCLSLLINIFFEAGIGFLLITFIGVCSINTIIMTNICRLRNKKRKEKSKEI